ncbi:MAG: MBL fold metallo-hydrolase [Rhodocyclales bacterium]|nr:MBL fold metallo-hydrolase [Rhodocyclales bacterium]
MSHSPSTIGAMKLRIHRGANEIGGSCVEVESAGERILIDAGMPLNFPLGASPKPFEVDSSTLCAIIISHAHLDHYGLLPWMPLVPVVMGGAGRRILQAAAPFMPQPPPNLSGPDLVNRQPIQIGPFSVTPFLVDHSAYDAYALLIEANGKRLFYSGDFRAHGRKHGLVDHLIASPPANIDALVLEGTTLGRMDSASIPSTEDDLDDELSRIFRTTGGLALIQASGQNIDRLVTIYRACLRTGRTMVVDLYTAMILEATGNPRIPQSDWNHMALCIPHRQRIQIKNNCWFEALRRHSSRRIYPKKHLAKNPGKYALIFRGLWMRDLERAECLDGACLVHSQWKGYLADPRFKDIDAWRQQRGMAFHQVHTSGHASPADLRRLATALSPKALIPIHSEFPERFDTIHSRVVRHADGEWWEV